MKRLCITLVFLASVASTSTRAQAPDIPSEARFMFPVGILCGASSEGFQEGVVRGAYRTVIHVLNPSASEDVLIAKTVARSLPYQDSLQPSAVIEDSLAPGAAMAIECEEIRQILPDPMTDSFRSGFLVLYSDAEIDVSVGYSAGPRDGEITTLTSDMIAARELCPFSIAEAGDHAYSDRICLGFAWTCENPETLTVALDGEVNGTIPLNRTEDYLLGDGSSTFCASTTDLADGPHSLEATLSCEQRSCTLSQPFEVVNSPFRLLTVTADRKRYRGSDTVNVTVVLSQSVDEVEADFSLLDSAFSEENLTIEETDTPGTYAISYRIDGIDNTNPPGIYLVPLRFSAGGVTRGHNGLRVGYVRDTDNLLAPVDEVPTTTVVSSFPDGDASPVTITELDTSKSLILPLTTVTITGIIEALFIDGQPRAEVEAAAGGYSLIWREADLSTAGAYRVRPATLSFDCAPGGQQLCSTGQFTVELGFPADSNALAKEGPHERELQFAILDPDGGVSDIATIDITIGVLNDQMFAGTPQNDSGSSSGDTVGQGTEFRLHHGAGEGEEANALTLVLTWDGENGPGANVIPGVDGLPDTLDALDLNIGIHRAPGGTEGHGGWWGNTGNAELLRKSNTCFTGQELGQPSNQREHCACADASDLNMEVIAYPPGVELDIGSDGEGTFGAEYYIYDSCGSQEDTTATMTAYFCGIAQEMEIEIVAALSEENMDLDENWGPGCQFGAPCHNPKDVPTGFNETGGFYEGFDFNPTDCSARPVINGHVSYMAPINFALNDPSQAGDLADNDPTQDQSWSFFDENLNATGWTAFDLPFTRIEARLADGTEEVVAQAFTDEDGNFTLSLDPDYAANGESGLVVVEAIARSSVFDFRVVENFAQATGDLDPDAWGSDDLHRATLLDEFDPVANQGEQVDISLNDGPDDEDGKEDAGAFHILRNTTLAALYIQSLGQEVEPLTSLYDRDSVLVNSRCDRAGSFYRGSGRFIHFQSSGPNVTQLVCPEGQSNDDGTCAMACELEQGGADYTESRVDFNYMTHMHEFVHHMTSVLTSIESWTPGDGRASSSHFGNTGEKTSLNEGIATAFGSVLASNLIFDMFGPGQPMNPTLVQCADDDITNCDLSLAESVDWLTIRNKGDIIRPGPDWQPQKDCAPGGLGCGCFLGTCANAGNSCVGGYCVDASGACTPGTQGCSVGDGCDMDDLRENGNFCVLPVSYSDGWTWRVLWDLMDEGEDVQPETSHWRTSQMSDAEPDVGEPYDTFGGVHAFWRVLIDSVGNDALTPVTDNNFHPNLADLIDRWRCEMDDETVAALDAYLVQAVEFPYHDPTESCP